MNVEELSTYINRKPSQIISKFPSIAQTMLKKGILIQKSLSLDGTYDYKINFVTPQTVDAEQFKVKYTTAPEGLYSAKDICNMLNLNYYTSGVNLCKIAANAGLQIEKYTQADFPRHKDYFYIVQNNMNLEGETWIVSIYPSFEVSNLGRVRKICGKKLLGSKSANGYVYLTTNKTNRKNDVGIVVHRLIYFSFHKELDITNSEIQIDHINAKRDDNRLVNLRAVTAIKNSQNRDNNQANIGSLVTQMLIKFGYDNVKTFLIKSLSYDVLPPIITRDKEE